MNVPAIPVAPVLGALLVLGLVAGGLLPAAAAEPIRLEQKLAEAKISSPLLRVQAVKSLLKLRGVRSRSVLKRDFSVRWTFALGGVALAWLT